MTELTNINSKLPQIGTSIFATMSKMANDYNAINLSQGFPDFNCSDKLVELVNHYMQKGFNQYENIQQDTDLDNLKLQKERWDALMKKYFPDKMK